MIPNNRNRDRRIFKGLNQDKGFHIGKGCDGHDTNWPIRCCSGSEVLNQPLPVFAFTDQHNGIEWYQEISNS